MLLIAIMVFFSISCEKPRRGGSDDGGGNGENVLSTLPVTNVTTNSATLGGNIIDSDFEYTEKGVCYSESPNPTTDDYKLAVPGAETGIYTIEATDLSQNTTC